MIEYAMTFLGVPYKWGGANPVEGVDCSGLIQCVLASVWLDPPGDQSAQGLYDHFVKNALHLKGAGAIVFYGKSIQEVSHVALMINDSQIIEAGGGGSKTITREDAAKQSAYVRIRPFGQRNDVVAVLMPSYP